MKKHLWIMILCCLIPLVGIIAAQSLGVPLGRWGTFAFLVLCPLSHILLMGAMGHGNHDHKTTEDQVSEGARRKIAPRG